MIFFDMTGDSLHQNVFYAASNGVSGNSKKPSNNDEGKKENGNKRKGFASMSIQKRQQIAKKGGEARKIAALNGNAPSYSQIGQKGGKAGTKSK